MKIPFFGKPAYAMPQVSPIPEGQEDRRNGVLINEKSRSFRVEIFDHNSPEDIMLALGALEVAKDVIKQQLSLWHQKEAARKSILVPKANGDLHVR